MDFNDLRQTPVYRTALTTSSVIGSRPARLTSAKEAHLRESYELRDAALRLDHLIRRALSPSLYFPEMYHLSAIKAFIEVIEPRLPHMRLIDQPKALAFVMPRLELANRIIERADAMLIEARYPTVSSQEFRDFVTVSGFTPEAAIWDNPMYQIDVASYPFGPGFEQGLTYQAFRSHWS